MRITIIILTVLVLILLSLNFVNTRELNDINRLQKSELREKEKQIEAKEKALTHAYDSLAQTKLLYADSLREAREERVRAEERTRIQKIKFEAILFVAHTDSSRTAELTKLYPSWKK